MGARRLCSLVACVTVKPLCLHMHVVGMATAASLAFTNLTLFLIYVALLAPCYMCDKCLLQALITHMV